MTPATIADIKTERLRHEIEARYQNAIAAFRQQYEVNVRLMNSELQMKCHVVKMLRAAELLELERETLNV